MRTALPFRFRTLGSALGVTLALAACRQPEKGIEVDRSGCTGAPPTCYIPAPDECCAEPSEPAECGPEGALAGTHLRWMCPGAMTMATNCRGVGATCVPRVTSRDPTRVPHAVVPLVTTDMDLEAGAPDEPEEPPTRAPKKPDKRKRRH